jgi:hypothetical protein
VSTYGRSILLGLQLLYFRHREKYVLNFDDTDIPLITDFYSNSGIQLILEFTVTGYDLRLCLSDDPAAHGNL